MKKRKINFAFYKESLSKILLVISFIDLAHFIINNITNFY